MMSDEAGPERTRVVRIVLGSGQLCYIIVNAKWTEQRRGIGL